MARAIKRKVEPYEKSIGIKSKSSKAHIPREVDLYHRPLRLFHQKDRIARSHQQANSWLRRSRRMYGLVRLEMRRLLLYKTLSSLTMLSHLLIWLKALWEIIRWPTHSQLWDSQSQRQWSWNLECLMRKLRFLPKRIWTLTTFTNLDQPRVWETSFQPGIKWLSSLLLCHRTLLLNRKKRKIKNKLR